MRVQLACGLWSCLRGLKRLAGFGGVLMLVPCRDVHTFGMRQPIDIAFVTSEGRVAASYRAVPPRRRRRCREAAAVLERYASREPWPEAGESLALDTPKGLSVEEKQEETIMKTCPTCHAVAFDDAPVCYGCLHRFDAGSSEDCQGPPPSGSAALGIPAPDESSPSEPQETEAPKIQPPGFCIRMVPAIGQAGEVKWDCAVELAS